MKRDSDFFKLISNICEEKNIKMRTASFGYIIELEKNGIKKHMVGTSLELNSASSFKIASDKFATYSILVQNSIPVIKYNMVFNSITRSEYENKDILKAMMWFDEYNGKVILKANTSSEGKDVFCITNKEELKIKIAEEFADGKDSVSICPFYDINFEYRAIFLDGEILLCYKKQKPFVIGDGKTKLKELILQKNITSFYEDLDLDYIPKIDEKVEVSWKHNLSQGATASLDIDKNVKEEVLKLAKKAGNAIGIRFASVDIAELKTNELLVMEINSSVCMNKFSEQIENGKELEKEIFSKAIDKMF
jgi:glutathione synthase/RimK-type ligase-like ATP-grasp enzyme